jgi:hypothetical protein
VVGRASGRHGRRVAGHCLNWTWAHGQGVVVMATWRGPDKMTPRGTAAATVGFEQSRLETGMACCSLDELDAVNTRVCCTRWRANGWMDRAVLLPGDGSNWPVACGLDWKPYRTGQVGRTQLVSSPFSQYFPMNFQKLQT